MFKKDDFYRLDRILSEKALINILYAGRNKGKSFAAKEWTLEECFKNNELFVLSFRRRSTRKSKRSKESYFKDAKLDIKRITEGLYTEIVYKGECYYYGYRDENDKLIYGPLAGYFLYLEDAEEGLKSEVFENVYYLILEEFITSEGYLYDEPYLFDSLLSTVFRDRIGAPQTRIFMIGNPVSRVCPYITEWHLDFMKTMAVNEIKVVYNNNRKIAVERIPPRKEKGISAAFSRKGQQVEEGEWMTEDLPLLLNWQKYDEIYDFIFTWEGFAFHCHCLSDDDSLFLLVHSYTKFNKENKKYPFPKDKRVIGDIDSTSLLYTKGFIPINENEKIIFNLIKANKIFFVDTLQGTDFLNCLKNLKRSY